MVEGHERTPLNPDEKFPPRWIMLPADGVIELRAYLAGQALVGILAHPSDGGSKELIASYAVDYAEAVMKELAK